MVIWTAKGGLRESILCVLIGSIPGTGNGKDVAGLGISEVGYKLEGWLNGFIMVWGITAVVVGFVGVTWFVTWVLQNIVVGVSIGSCWDNRETFFQIKDKFDFYGHKNWIVHRLK